jgi:hypothetical protein
MPKTNEQLYEEAERQAVMDAIGETEQEIFDDALNRDPDDNDGDRSLEEMDGEDVLDEDNVDGEAEEEETGEAEGDVGAEETPPETRHDQAGDRQDARGVPSARMREEAERRRVAEAERDRAQAEAREVRARLDAVEARQRQPQRQDGEPDPNAPPDMFADPEGWARHQRESITREFNERRINGSFDDAREQHGDKFVEAFQTLQRSQNPQLVSAIVNANNPGRALMRWHQQQSLVSEIGDDPAAFRQKVREELLADPEVRRAVITGAREQATRTGNTQTRLPPSLNGATGGTSHRGAAMNGRGRDAAYTNRSIEQEIFDSAFED